MTNSLIKLLLIVVALASPDEAKDEVPSIALPDGFEASMIYSPTENGQGSWVSLTTDNKGRLLASSQYGKIYRLTLTAAGNVQSVDSIQLSVGRAQGMLWTDRGLYVSVNSWEEEGTEGSGVYLLKDTNGDDSYDAYERLLKLEGNGEHGPHALIPGTSEGEIYLVAGNHTYFPKGTPSVLNGNWQEDRLFPSILDPRGHANEIEPPGGWIAKSGDHGATWNVIASGFRNAYDIALNKEGDLFTYDSDMEWDLGTPWYRPTRVCHVIPGAEFGWRTGSGKWPAYYPDNLPGVLDIGQGSPTGITFGYGAKFPAAYQQSLFISDWSFGTMYQVDLKPEGGSYRASKKEFLSGTPLPISDVVIAGDGNMYFTTGGRKGVSYLYRVTYTGNESTAPIENPTVASDKLIHEIGGMSAMELVTHLGSSDRFVRYAARVALEKYPADTWWSSIASSSDPTVKIQGSLAAIRTGAGDNTFATLNSISEDELSIEEKLDLTRAYGLFYARGGSPDNVPSNLPDFPSDDPRLDRELCELLVFLGDDSVIDPALDIMETFQAMEESELTPKEILERHNFYGKAVLSMYENRPAEHSLSMAMSLSHLKTGWTDHTRNRYFTWFYDALSKTGGFSYGGFVEKVRLAALDNVPDEERKKLAQISGESLLNQPVFTSLVNPPKGPGRNWQLNEARQVIDGQLEGRSFERGKELYSAVLCASCHSINGAGGNIGPDLTQAGTRFSNTDLLNSMILPSMSISDQYGSTLFKMNDGSTRIGRVVRTTEDEVYIHMNPYTSDETALKRAEISSQQPSPISMMPPGLINALNEDELRDLLAYLKSGGNATHELYSGTE